jgi:hypothetical protein
MGSTPDAKVLNELQSVCRSFLVAIASKIPPETADLTAKFIVENSEFCMNCNSIRSGPDNRAVISYYDDDNLDGHGLPVFDWPWSEFEREILENGEKLPVGCLSHWESLDSLQRKKLDLLSRTDDYFLGEIHIARLRDYQKNNDIGPAKTKNKLIDLIVNLGALTGDLEEEVLRIKNDQFTHLQKLEENVKLETAEIHKHHLLKLAQVRVDSYFSAKYGYGSPKRENDSRRQNAVNKFNESRLIDMQQEEKDFRQWFISELGSKWESNKTAVMIFKNFLNDRRRKKSASVQDFIDEENEHDAQFMHLFGRKALKIYHVCENCAGRDEEIKILNTNALPPYTLFCDCSYPIWVTVHNEPTSDIAEKQKTNTEIAISNLVSSNKSGLGIRIPTLTEMIEIAEIQKKENSGRESTSILNKLKKLYKNK